MLMLEDDMLAARIRATMGDLLKGADQLKGLAYALDGFCGLTANAQPEEIKMVAIGVHAAAVQALLTASTAVGISERLSVVAMVLDSAQSNRTQGKIDV